MDPTAAVNLALTALQAILGVVAELKSQHGLSNDAILAQARTLTAGNDDAYQKLVAALTPQ